MSQKLMEVDHDLYQDDDLVSHLANSLQLAYPKAKPAYWRYRAWQLLIWQPIYLSLLATYKFRQELKLDNFKQALINNSVIVGFSGLQLSETSNHELHSYSQLQQKLQHYFFILNQLGKINKKIGQRLLMDCGLYGIAQLPNLNNKEKSLIANHWKEHAPDITISHKIQYSGDIRCNSSELEVIRDTCCLHYLVQPKQLCSNCPIF